MIGKVNRRNPTLLVLGNPLDPNLALLEQLPGGALVAAGDTVEAFAGALDDAEVALSWFAPRALLEEVFARAPRLRWIHSSSAGLDTVLFPELERSAVMLTNARGVYSASLGEFTIAAMLFFAKELRRMVHSQEAGVWDSLTVEMIEGSTLAIAGYGDIGRAIAVRARAFGMNLIGVRRRPGPDDVVTRVHPLSELRAILPECDYLAVCLPLTAETRGSIGTGEFEQMKTSAVLINVGRGPVVDEAALIDALARKRIRGAAIDVFETEPLPAGHPFYSLENVLLSPHCADHTADWKQRSMALFLENFRRYREGEPLLNVVDKQRGY